MTDQRPLEREVRAAIRRRLKKYKPDLKMVPYIGSSGGVAGTPDILGSYKGRSICIEAKRLGEKATAIQKVQLAMWKRAGAATCVVDNADDAEAFILSIDAGTV